MTAPTTDISGVSLIGDAETTGAGLTFTAVDPVTGKQLEPTYHDVAVADIARACTLARDAFDTYRKTTFEQRASFLESIAAEIEGLGTVLSDRVTAETGIPTARVNGEIARTTGQLRLFASVVRAGEWTRAHLDTPNPERTPLPKPDLRRRDVPLGPVAVFAASNFPLAFSVAGGDTASALAAGAPVVVKAHPAHPGTSELVGRAIRRAVRDHDLPEGTFSLVAGTAREVGVALVNDPNITAVAFTGSRQGGLALASAAAQRPVPVPVFAEMSSVNPVFVLPGALGDRGAALGGQFIASMNIGVGQLCTSPGLVFIVDGIGADEFVSAAEEAVRATPSAPMLYQGMAEAFSAGGRRLESNKNVTAAARGADDAAIACGGAAQIFVTTADRFLADPDLQNELFGPSSVIVRVSGTAELATIIDRLEGQLTATVHADDSDHDDARVLLEKLELVAGRILFNGWPTGVEVGHAIVHGGPFPATSAPATTSVGTRAIERFLRPVAYQNVPDALLPPEVQSANPLRITRHADGTLSQ